MVTSTQHEHARGTSAARKGLWIQGGLLHTLQTINIYSVELTRHNDIGVRGGDGCVWRSTGRSSLTGAIARYGHIDANAFGFNHLVVALDKGQESECNSSGSKTHKSQEPCVMALNIDKRPGATSMALVWC